VTPDGSAESLRHYHYRHGAVDLYFLTNESEHEVVDTDVSFRANGSPELWDPLTGSVLPARFVATPHATRVRVRIEPYGSVFLAFDPSDTGTVRGRDPGQGNTARAGSVMHMTGPWEVSRATAKEYPAFSPEPLIRGLGDWTAPGLLPRFSGTLRYRTSFTVPAAWHGRYLVLDLGEVYELARIRLDGQEVAIRICPPYRCPLGPVEAGPHTLEIEVTNTLAAQVPDPFSRVVAGEPSGLLGPVRILG
jgi:hypothetical protein